MSDEDFSALLGEDGDDGDIQRLSQEKRIALNKQNKKDASQSSRKQNAESFNVAAADPLGSENVEMVARQRY